jgi:hypothetical protein
MLMDFSCLEICLQPARVPAPTARASGLDAYAAPAHIDLAQIFAPAPLGLPAAPVHAMPGRSWSSAKGRIGSKSKSKSYVNLWSHNALNIGAIFEFKPYTGPINGLAQLKHWAAGWPRSARDDGVCLISPCFLRPGRIFAPQLAPDQLERLLKAGSCHLPGHGIETSAKARWPAPAMTGA